ncbi:MAG: hypothetical protein HYZ53_04760 [Planctomycetes bacterium]|nr:hypothetical protein [Planctomycetota bacterium]
MFSKSCPEFAIDLDRPEPDRWAEVIRDTREPAAALIREAGQALTLVPEVLQHIFAQVYKRSGGLYVGEINAWAEGLGVPLGTATVLNCAYELSHLHLPNPLGCTAGARWVEGRGMVHLRTLDWPLPTMGRATCRFRFRKGSREFLVVGVPGHVGVLSGMFPGGYSATINWAPPAAFPTFDFGPAFLLRNVLETCDTYAAAVEALRDTRLSTSVFFTVCGVEPGEACVIERTQRAAFVRGQAGSSVVQANHHQAADFVKHNAALATPGNAEFLTASFRRAEVLAEALERGGTPHGQKPAPLAQALDLPPVLNADTVQKMVFCPRTGEAEVWRRDGPASGAP